MACEVFPNIKNVYNSNTIELADCF